MRLTTPSLLSRATRPDQREFSSTQVSVQRTDANLGHPALSTFSTAR
jgi:hypothetical protein